MFDIPAGNVPPKVNLLDNCQLFNPGLSARSAVGALWIVLQISMTLRQAKCEANGLLMFVSVVGRSES